MTKTLSGTRPLTCERIDKIFAEAEHQADYVRGLYREVIPDWDSVEKVHGWPSISERTSRYIYSKATAFDKEHHPGCLPGGAWMNSGFSGHDVEDLEDWTARLEGVEVVYEIDESDAA